MGEFFIPWRRKTGLFTLVMACVFMTGWVRSFTTLDQLNVDTAWNETFQSAYGSIRWSKNKFRENVRWDIKFGETSWSSGPAEILERNPHEWQIRLVSLGVFESSELNIAVLVIPYWSIVSMLMLLSTYLLLVKPRLAKPQKAVEPTPVDRT